MCNSIIVTQHTITACIQITGNISKEVSVSTSYPHTESERKPKIEDLFKKVIEYLTDNHIEEFLDIKIKHDTRILGGMI